MRGVVIPLAVATILATAPFALASGTATGTVKYFGARAHTLELKDGTIYTLPITFRDPGLKSGDRVSVIWEMENGEPYADRVSVQK